MATPQRWRLEVVDGPVLATDVEVAETIWSRFRGLMLRPALPAGHGLAIRPCNSIHMFFMRFPIDVLFVDADGTVLYVLNAIRPWRVSRLVRRSKAAIELPAGTAAEHGVGPGTRVRMVAG